MDRAMQTVSERLTRLGANRLEEEHVANILIVDDDSDSAELCSQLLQSAGHRTQTRANGEEGLEALATRELPDCVLLDVEMPVLNGPAMAHQMLLHDAGEERIPIALVSGRHDVSQIAARIGTPYFLRKATPDFGAVCSTSSLEHSVSE